MAYNKSKGKQKHGDVIYDKDTDTQIDFEQNEIKFRTGGSVRGSFTNGGLSVTGSLTGMTTVSASLGVSGSSAHFDEHVVSGHLSGTLIHGGTVNVGQGVFTVSNEGAVVGQGISGTVLSGSSTATLHSLNVGQGVATVSNEGAIVGQGISGTVLSGSSTATLHGLNVGQGVFTVSNEGAVVGASLDNSNGGITNAGSIAGATTIDGTGDLTMGTITMTGFTVDADGDTVVKTISGSSNADFAGTLKAAGERFSVDSDGDTSVKSLVSQGVVTAGTTVSGTTATVNKIEVSELTNDTPGGNIILQTRLTSSNLGYEVQLAGALTSSQGTFAVSADGRLSSSGGSNHFLGTLEAAGERFKVDSDGDTNVKSLTSEGIVSGTTATVNRLTVGEIGTDTDTAQIKLTNSQILIEGAILTSSNNGDRASFGGSLTSSQGRFHISNNGAVYAAGGDFTVALNGVVSASNNASFDGTLKAAGERFSVDADGDTNVKSLTSEGIVSGTTATVNKIEVSELTNDTPGGNIILQTRLTSSNLGYEVQLAGALTSSQGNFTISSTGIISSSASRNHFLGRLEAGGGGFTVDADGDVSGSGYGYFAGALRAGNEGFTVDADGDVVVKSLTVTEGFPLSGTAIQAHAVTASFIGPQTKPSLIKMEQNLITINGSAISASAANSQYFDYGGPVRFANNTVRFTHEGTGSMQQLIVSGNIETESRVIIGTGITASANQFHVAGDSGNIFTSGTISGSSHLDIGGDIRARQGSLTMAGTLSLGGGNIIGASGVSGSGNVTFGGKLEMLGKEFKIDNQADLSSSGDITIDGKLEVGSKRFIVQNDGDVSGSGYAYFAGKLEAAARGFRVDSDGDTIAKSLSSSLAVTAQNFAADGAVVVGGNISGAVLSGSAAATLHSLNVGQNLATISKEGIISTSRAISGSGGVHITGSTPVLAIGSRNDGSGPQDAMFSVRPSDTSNKVLALFQAAEVDGMRTCLGVTGSGQVLIGGMYLDGVLNVSGATAETLLAVKSDAVAQALKVQGDGKVGIGTSAPLHTLAVTASSGISLSGSTEISGTLTVNESLRAKQLHMTTHKFSPGDSNFRFVRFDSNGGDTGQTDNNKLTAPYSGKLIKVVARATNAAGSTVISLHTNVDGNQHINGTATEAITVDMAAANTTYTFTFTDVANYGPGDIVGIKFNPTNDPGTPTLTAVWEFDHNS